MQYGTRASGTLKPLNVTSLSTSKPGEVYQLDVEVDGIPNEGAAIAQALTLEQHFPDLQVLHVETCRERNVISIQMTDLGPGAWSWGGIFSAIPSIFLVIGIAVIAYILWQLWSEQSPLLLLIGIAGVVIFISVAGIWRAIPTPTAIRTEGKENDKRLRDSISTQISGLKEQRQTNKNILTDVRSELPAVQGDISTLKKKKKLTSDERTELQSLEEKESKLKRTRDAAQDRLLQIADQIEALSKLA